MEPGFEPRESGAPALTLNSYTCSLLRGLLKESYCKCCVEKNCESISEINEEEWGDPLVMSAMVTEETALPSLSLTSPHASLLSMEPSLLISGSSIPLPTQAKNFRVFLCIPFSSPHVQHLGKSGYSQKVSRHSPGCCPVLGAAQSAEFLSLMIAMGA